MTLIYTPSPGTRKYLFTTPFPRFAVLSPQGGQNKWHCMLSTSRGEGDKVEILNQVQDDTLLTRGDDI